MSAPTMRERYAVLREQHGVANPENVWEQLSEAGRARVDDMALAMRRFAQQHAAQQRAASGRNSG